MITIGGMSVYAASEWAYYASTTAYYASTTKKRKKKLFDVFGPFMGYMSSGTHLELTRVKNDS